VAGSKYLRHGFSTPGAAFAKDGPDISRCRKNICAGALAERALLANKDEFRKRAMKLGGLSLVFSLFFSFYLGGPFAKAEDSSSITSSRTSSRTSSPTSTQRYLMAALGDSITAGFLADTHLKELITREGAVNGALSVPPFSTKNSDSWASGKSIYSHYLLLKRSLKNHGDLTPLDIMNTAIPGDKTQDLIAQAKKVVLKMKSGKYKALKYVVLLIGANDICSEPETSESDMKESLKTVFQTLAQTLSEIHQGVPIRILVSGLPKIPDLAREDVLESRTAFDFTCRFFRDEVLKDCTPLLNWTTQTEYRQRVSIVEDRNRMIKEASETAQKLFPGLEITYSDRLFSTWIDPELLALDCFHPSREGQQMISDLLWEDQPWF
jgi:lysophospholipase L1-like esterase